MVAVLGRRWWRLWRKKCSYNSVQSLQEIVTEIFLVLLVYSTSFVAVVFLFVFFLHHFFQLVILKRHCLYLFFFISRPLLLFLSLQATRCPFVLVFHCFFCKCISRQYLFVLFFYLRWYAFVFFSKSPDSFDQSAKILSS